MSIESEALRRQLLQQEQEQQPMSQEDQVVIRQSQPEAPGFYIDSDRIAQEAFNQALLQQQSEEAMRRLRSPYQATNNPVNPNVSYVQPTRTTALPDGTSVSY